MKNTSCCFTGHRDIVPEKLPVIKEKLINIISDAIDRGYTDFYNGGAIGFDQLAAEAVLELKREHPDIRLHIIVPCASQAYKWTCENRQKYERVIACADEVKILSPFYFKGCMQIRNRYMADASSLCIAYLNRTTGGTADTIKYAQKEMLEIINISDNL